MNKILLRQWREELLCQFYREHSVNKTLSPNVTACFQKAVTADGKKRYFINIDAYELNKHDHNLNDACTMHARLYQNEDDESYFDISVELRNMQDIKRGEALIHKVWYNMNCAYDPLNN